MEEGKTTLIQYELIMQQLIAHDPTASFPSFLALVILVVFRKLKNDIFLRIDWVSKIFRHFFHELVCLFLVPILVGASAHARHVWMFVVSRISAGNYFDKN